MGESQLGNFVLIVEIEIREECAEEFFRVIGENARLSVTTEPGCRQFDVLRQLDDPSRVMLYEVYDDLAAFQAHTRMPHVLAFHEAAKPLIISQKKGRRMECMAANASPKP